MWVRARGLAYPFPILFDCLVVENENCYPMVDPAKSNSEMYLSRKLSTTKEGLVIDKDEEKEKERI